MVSYNEAALYAADYRLYRVEGQCTASASSGGLRQIGRSRQTASAGPVGVGETRARSPYGQLLLVLVGRPQTTRFQTRTESGKNNSDRGEGRSKKKGIFPSSV